MDIPILLLLPAGCKGPTLARGAQLARSAVTPIADRCWEVRDGGAARTVQLCRALDDSPEAVLCCDCLPGGATSCEHIAAVTIVTRARRRVALVASRAPDPAAAVAALADDAWAALPTHASTFLHGCTTALFAAALAFVPPRRSGTGFFPLEPLFDDSALHGPEEIHERLVAGR